MEAIAGAELRQMDFLEEEADAQVRAWLGGQADVVMSDMAAAASGHPQTDYMRIVALCEVAADLAEEVLAPGGVFVSKVLGGGAEPALVARLNKSFAKVAHVKPRRAARIPPRSSWWRRAFAARPRSRRPRTEAPLTGLSSLLRRSRPASWRGPRGCALGQKPASP